MAFWGIEVKPGKPITHSCEKARGGRLRISRATLGIGEAARKTILQCNVGKRSPVLLCVLLPNKTESCHLDLQFTEADDVVFSVIGPRSVHLAGYYFPQSQRSNLQSDTESYGVDIENTQTEGSSYCSDDDKFDDSFIDDEEIQASLQSPVLGNKGVDEGKMKNDSPKDRKARGKPLRKKFQVVESDSDTNSHGSEDEDGYRIPLFKNEKAVQTTTADAGEKIAQVTEEMDDEAKDHGVCGSESRQTVDPLDINGQLEREAKVALAEEGIELKNEKLELPNEVQNLDKIMVSNEDGVLTGDTTHGSYAKDTIIDNNFRTSNKKDQMRSLDIFSCGINLKPKKKREVHLMEEETSKVQTENKDHIVNKEDTEHEFEASTTGGLSHGSNAKNTIIDKNMHASNQIDQMQSLDVGWISPKPKKKRKVRSTEEKTSKVQAENENHNVHREDKEHQVEASTDLEIDATKLLATPELGSINGKKSKKRKKEPHLEGTDREEIDEKCHYILKGDNLELGLLQSDNMTKDLPAYCTQYQEHQRLDETSIEEIGAKCHSISKDGTFMQGLVQTDSTMKDLPAADGEYSEQQIDKNISNIIAELRADDSQVEKKTKKKKKKTKGKEQVNMSVAGMTDNQETTPMTLEDQITNAVPIRRMTLSNGLVIEELASGPANGKVAARGKMVKINYTGMLKESGVVFDSQTAFKFRLGDEEFIEGWNVGIDGMHVGDKRRLIIAPSMGFGNEGIGENVPPNSWLVYDIELVSVRK